MTEGKGLMCWQNQAIILPPLAIHPKSRCIAQDRAKSGLLRRPFTALVLPIGTEYLIDDGLVDAMCGEPFGNALALSAHLFGILLVYLAHPLDTLLFQLAHPLGMLLFQLAHPLGMSFVCKLQYLSAHGFPRLSLQGNAADIIYAC